MHMNEHILPQRTVSSRQRISRNNLIRDTKKFKPICTILCIKYKFTWKHNTQGWFKLPVIHYVPLIGHFLLMMMSSLIMEHGRSPSTWVSIKPKCAKTILKWVIVLTGRNVNLHMVLKTFAPRRLCKKKNITELKDVNLFRTKELVIMAQGANSLTLKILKLRGSKNTF